MSIVSLSRISKVYPLGKTTVNALNDIDLSIAEGDFVSIVGPSGSGKTTIMNIIGLIDTPSSGHIR
ncbi:MAG: ATP-binding cassette domain-containing protein, partial [Spirochaetota bacterium]|nr:ATP-binding cassette domain-containing protein [Spirochaetota bacterium]